ncbi:hypothetical protein A1O1_03738 [Capronia coronata CBS 617.96]|uniref:Transcription factor domain-containing protein n=1 Tax=Capronia coronata CBS 617.96 TaxID=1182541 RepID=W9YLS3_9EURO|nr:uncharacterized protein A1O1_03738 [Capronia coronata CBS 617.96]EXJ90635.1 hypothetical protein A1O1_03738 [Capronia coronata CBS 617.96]
MSSRRGSGRGRRADSSNPDFLWINRTADSERLHPSRDQRDELRTITSHARNWRASLRRQQRLYTAQTEASHVQSLVGWGRPRHSIVVSDSSSVETSASPSPIMPTAQTTGDRPESISVAYLETPADARWSRTAFRYATQVWLPFVFDHVDVLDETLGVSGSTQATMDYIIQGCMADRMHMYSLLAASMAFQKYVIRLQLDEHGIPEYCMGKALQSLRYHLASNPQVDEHLVFDLEALATFERYVHNFEGARAHLVMVQHLVESMGGLSMLRPPMRPLCWLADLAVAGGLGESPLLPLIWESDPGTLPREQMTDEILSDLQRGGCIPGGSALLHYASMVHPTLSRLIVDTVQWFHVQQHLHLHNYTQPAMQTWATRQAYILVHRLLSWSADTRATTEHEILQRLLSEGIKQAILLVVSDIFQKTNRIATANPEPLRDPTMHAWSTVSRLRSQLMRIANHHPTMAEAEQYEELVLWMTCLGLQQATLPEEIETQHDRGRDRDPDRDWFASLAARLAQRQHVTTTDELLQFLVRYLHRCDSTGRPDRRELEIILET